MHRTLTKLRNRQSEGFSLPEILVVVFILAAISAITISVIAMLQNSALRFQNTTTNQNQLNIAMNSIQRDLTQATSISSADTQSISFQSVQKQTAYQTAIFLYDGTNKNYKNLPLQIDASNLPNSTPSHATLIEQVYDQSGALKSQTALVAGYRPVQGQSIFSYYTTNGTPISASQGAATVARVQFSLRTLVDNRVTPIELSSSATLQQDIAGVRTDTTDVPQPVTLFGKLNYESTTADKSVWVSLDWTTPDSAQKYIVEVTHNGIKSQPCTQNDSDVHIWPNPTDNNPSDTASTTYSGTKCASPNLEYGETYSYDVIAVGANQVQSAVSNVYTITVRPPQTQFVNINTKASLTSTKGGSGAETGTSNPLGGATYTVARNLTNQLTWKPSNGATGYTLTINGATVTINGGNVTSYQDKTTPYYGLTTKYTVTPFNTGMNETGGPGVTSDNLNLISPPTAPTIDGTAYNQATGTAQNTVKITAQAVSDVITGSILMRNTSTGSAGDCTESKLTNANNNFGAANGSSTKDTVEYGSSTCYGVYAYNDAGNSPLSNPVRLNVGPGAFQIVNVNTKAGLNDQTNGYFSTVARDLQNQVSWNTAPGADGYQVFQNGTKVYDSNSVANVHKFINSHTYGDVTSYYVVAYSVWSGETTLTQQSDNTVSLISPPTAPTISATGYSSIDGNPYNTVKLERTGANSMADTVYRNMDDNNIASCTTLSATNDSLADNAGATTNDYVDYGSSTCYGVRASNDAGYSPLSNTYLVLVGPGRFQVVNPDVNAALNTIAGDGNRYTVARDLTDQVAWNTSNGADGYRIVRDGNVIADINDSGTHFYQDGHTYGDISTYYVQAYSQWGSTRSNYVNSDNAVQLNSPPKAPSISGNSIDGGGNNPTTQSSNYVNLSGTASGSPTYGVALSRLSANVSSQSCSAISGRGSNNIGDLGNVPGNALTDSYIGWGSSSCYRAYAYNPAGTSPASNDIKLNQMPSPFNVTKSVETQKGFDMKSTKIDDTTLSDWYDSDNADGGTGFHYSYVSNRVYEISRPLVYDLAWSSSVGRDGNYSVDFNSLYCANRSATDLSTQDPVADSNESRSVQNLTVGCSYRLTLTSTAANGLTRNSPTTTVITSPNVADETDAYILTAKVSGTNKAARWLDTAVNYTNGGYTSSAHSQIDAYSNIYFTKQGDPGLGGEHHWDFSANGGGHIRTMSDSSNMTGLDTYAHTQTNMQWLSSGDDRLPNNTLMKSVYLAFDGNVGATSCVVNTDQNQSSCATSFGSSSNPNDNAFYPESAYNLKRHPIYVTVQY